MTAPEWTWEYCAMTPARIVVNFVFLVAIRAQQLLRHLHHQKILVHQHI